MLNMNLNSKVKIIIFHGRIRILEANRIQNLTQYSKPVILRNFYNSIAYIDTLASETEGKISGPPVNLQEKRTKSNLENTWCV